MSTKKSENDPRIRFGRKLKDAREKKGMTLEDLAAVLERKLSRQALHKYETGTVLPDSSMLGSLATALDVTTDYFFSTAVVEMGPVSFRKGKKLNGREKKMIVAQAREYLERYLELEQIMNIDTAFSNPFGDKLPIETLSDIETAATRLRDFWKLGNDPIPNACELLEEHHIKVVEIEAGDEYDGMQMMINGNIPVIAVNTNNVKKDDRKRFTLMHELAHLLLSFKKECKEREVETFCHQFAAAMLLTGEALKKELGESRSRLMMPELGQIKQRYGISIQAIVMRAKDLSIISDYYCRQFFFFIKQMGWKVDEPVEYVGNEVSGRFNRLLYRGLAEEMLSVSKAAALKNQSLAEFREQSLLLR